MTESENQQLSAEWRAIVLSELKEIKEAQKEMRKDITSQILTSASKEDLDSFKDKLIKIDERLTTIESISNKFIGGAIILNIIFVAAFQYIFNMFKIK